MEEPIQDTPQEPAGEPYVRSTACDHYLVLESPDTAVCTKGCGHGCMVTEGQYVEDGKLSQGVS